jgi:hypothetical protein
MMAFLIFLIIFLIFPSIIFGTFTAALYLLLKRAHKKIKYSLPVVITLLFPAMYLPLSWIVSKAISDDQFAILPIVGYLMMIVTYFILASFSALIPIPLIERLRKSVAMVFLASTLGFFLTLLVGFAEVMGAGRYPYEATKISILGDIYFSFFKILAVSAFVYLTALAILGSEKGC